MATKKKIKVPPKEEERGPRGGRMQRDPKAVLDIEDRVKAQHPADTQQMPKTKLPGGGKKNQFR